MNGLSAVIEGLKAKVANAPDSPEPVCPDCDGYGNVIGPHGAQPCHCLLQSRRLDALKAIDRQVLARQKYALWRPETLDPTYQPFLAAKAYLAHLRSWKPGGLILCGPTGNGKTTAAVYVAGQLARENPLWTITLWLNATRTMRDLIFGMGDSKRREDLIDRIYCSDAIFLDDIGGSQAWSNSHERMESLLYDVTDYVLGNEIPAVLVFNLSKKALFDGGGWIQDPRLRSRLSAPYWTVANCTGPDLRQKGN